MGAPFPRKQKINPEAIETPSLPLSEGRALTSDLGLDETELALLHAVRLISASYANPESQAWEHAFDHMIVSFGEANGPVISYALTNVMRAMRKTRKSVFKFNNPFCPCCRIEVTAMEKHLIKTIKSMRDGQPMAANADAMMLCEGHSTVRFIEAVQGLVALLPVHEAPVLKKRMRFFTT